MYPQYNNIIKTKNIKKGKKDSIYILKEQSGCHMVSRD
jgi:hypothetical protein